MKKRFGLLLAVLSVCTLISCKSTISLYDQYAYTQATSIKVDALNVMDLATDSFNAHTKEVAALTVELQKIYEYDKNRPKNVLTTAQWELMTDSLGHLMGGFLVKWKKDGKEGTYYLYEKKKQIGMAFDQIIKLEISKNKQDN